MRRTLPALLLGLLLTLTACSSEDRSSAEDSSDMGAPAEGGFDEGTDAMADEDTGGSTAEDPARDAEGDSAGSGVVTFGGAGSASIGRQLARTASLILEVDDVEQAAGRVAAAAQRAGGFVSGAEVRGGDFGYGTITLRVPASSLDATVEDLGTIGVRVVESSIHTEDLTDQLTDIGARIANLERLETELQALLADVRDGDPQANQLLQVFERLNEVRGEIERLNAQQSGAEDRVSLATINVELIPTSIAPEEVEPDPQTAVGRAWQATQDAFAVIGEVLIWLGITILPVALAVLAIPALLVWLLIRWLRSRRELESVAHHPAPPPPSTPVDPAPPSEPTDS